MKLLPYLAFTALFALSAANAKLAAKVDDPRRTGEKSIIRVTLKNSFAEKIESARATLFLLDEKGKPVDQMTRWVIGGTKQSSALAPNASTTYNFVVTTDKPFAT